MFIFSVFIFISAIFSVKLLLNYFFTKNVPLTSNFGSKRIIKPNPENTEIKDFEKLLIKNKIEYSDISDVSEEGSIQVSLKTGTIVIFSKIKQPEIQISSLHDIVSRLTIENRIPKEIDFSFNKTIVNF